MNRRKMSCYGLDTTSVCILLACNNKCNLGIDIEIKRITY